MRNWYINNTSEIWEVIRPRVYGEIMYAEYNVSHKYHIMIINTSGRIYAVIAKEKEEKIKRRCPPEQGTTPNEVGLGLRNLGLGLRGGGGGGKKPKKPQS